MFPSLKTSPKRRCTFVLVAMTLLGGCSTPQQRAARAQADVEQMMAEYGPACARLGYTVQSDPWRRCVLDLGFRDEMQRYGPYGPGDGWGPGGYWRGGWGRYW